MSTSLPQNDKSAEDRRSELEKRQSEYRYDYSWPVGVATAAELPDSQDYSLPYLLRSAEVYAEIGANLAAVAVEHWKPGALVDRVEARFSNISPKEMRQAIFSTPAELSAGMQAKFPDSWQSFEDFFALWDHPDIVSFYHKGEADLDLAFAWQRLAGVNPMVLELCKQVPGHFAVDNNRYQRVMGHQDSLDRAAAEERLYLCDYAVLDGIEAGITKGIQKYISAPLALFAVDLQTKKLRPVAIQLGQVPGDQNPVYSPGDGWHWRMAMNLVQVADANTHEGIYHLGRTHMVMEAVNLAMERNFSGKHPLYHLLKPHLETTFAINHSAKTSLIAEGGTVDNCFAPKIEDFGKVVKQALDTYPIASATPGEDLKRRGLLNTESLPQAPYRDDCQLLFSAVEQFVDEYVKHYYKSDADVQNDGEVQAFARELGAQDGGRLVEVPVPQTIDQLVALITKFIYIAGPGHSAVNFPQFPFMGFVSNMPGASYRPQPTASTPNNEDEFTPMLPPWNIAMEDVTMIYFLSNMRNSTLGDYGPFHFQEPRLLPILSRFRKNLKQIEKTITERNKSRLMPYPFLLPSQILQSISI